MVYNRDMTGITTARTKTTARTAGFVMPIIGGKAKP